MFQDKINKVTNLNSKLDNAIDHFDMPSYDELSQAFNEFNNEMISLYLLNQDLELKVLSLLNKLRHQKTRMEIHK